MNDLISRQAAIEAIKTYWKQQVDALDKHSGFETFTDACDAILKHNVGILNAIEQLPSAQPKKGKDICDTAKGHCEFKCSVCGVEIGVVEGGDLDGGYFNYCPNCGARMEET